jgi:DNA invertase Pin-like site-specific DNA recombinase
MGQLRVAKFMRGSTNKQTSQGQAKKKSASGKKSARPMVDENDLPLQNLKLNEYIESKPNWIDSGLEYVEAGVSGFHTHSSKRDGLNKAFEDAKAGLFDVLLVYKLDRIGRRSSESLNHAVKFLRYCKVWVVDKDREFTNNGDADEIVNFIEFWSAKKSSIDTKTRVTDMMKLIHKEGYWTGGNPPYGYRNHPEISNMLEVIPHEAEIVKRVYRMYTSDGYGMLKIAGMLNEEGKKTKTGKEWKSDSIRKILRNTIYKGYLSYGKTKTIEGEFGSYQAYTKEGEESVSDRYWEQYDLVGEELWGVAQRTKKTRVTNENLFGKKTPSRSGTGRGLLVGLLKCECGSNMTYGTSSDWLDSKRTKKGEPYGIYRCLKRLKAGVHACGAKKGSYRSATIEEAVMNHLKEYMTELLQTDLLKDIQTKTLSASKEIDDKLEQAKFDVERWAKVKERSNNELLKIMMGEDSSFSEAQLKEMYDKAVNELENSVRLHDEMKALKGSNSLNEVDVLRLQDILNEWSELFDYATQEEKRKLVSSFVTEITLAGEEITVEVNFEVANFLEAISSARETASALHTQGITSSLHNSGSRSANGKYIAGMLIDSVRRTFPKPIRKHLSLKVS